MAIIRTVKQENPFVQLDKNFLEDTKLKWESKGLLAYLLSRPDSWQVRKNDLIKRAADSKTKVESALLDLMQHGYIYYYQERDEDGTFGEWVYEVYERPEFNPKLEYSIEEGKKRVEKRKNRNKEKNNKPKADNPLSDNPTSDYPPFNNNNDFNNNDFNNNLSMNKKVLELNIPNNLKKLLEQQIDRLIKNNFILEEIEIHYNNIKSQNLLTEEEYAHMLLSAIKNTTGEISNTINYLEKCVSTHIVRKSLLIQKTKSFANKKRDKLPKWLTSEHQKVIRTDLNKDNLYESKSSNEDFMTRKLEFEAMVAARMKEKELQRV